MALSSILKNLSKFGVRNYSYCINVNDPYVISAVRTPFGSFRGKLSSLTAVELATKATVAAIERSGICKDDIAEMVVGCQYFCGLRNCPAHQVAFFSGLADSTITSTVNKLCASGLRAIMSGCQMISCSHQEVVAVVGMESASNVPYMLRRKNPKLGNLTLADLIFHDGLIDYLELCEVTEFAEKCAKDYDISRKDQDEYGIRSYTKSAEAYQRGEFAQHLVPIEIKRKGQEDEVICEDEELRKLDLTKYYDLVPEVGKCGTITTGNSAALCDGAAVVILASGNYILKKNIKPLGRIVSYADAALERKQFCVAPAVAIPRALVKANITADYISVWEINETYAITPLVNARLLKLDMNRVNPNGGAISLGHPFGATGVRLIGQLALTMEPGQLGLAAIQHAGGGSAAMIVEKL